MVVVFEREKKLHYRTLYFSLIIVKALQLHRRRQITEPCKYCLMHVIFFFFFFSHVGNFRLIPYNWYQSLGLGLSGSNGRGFRKGI